MNNKYIYSVALEQSAKDMSCTASDFLKNENVVVISRDSEEARKYLKLPFACDLVSYGSNIVASVSPELLDIVSDYIGKYPKEHCFETPNMHVLNEAVSKLGYSICFMAEYFLPDMENIKIFKCGYSTRVLNKGEFEDLYTAEWSNALCEKRKHLDMLCVGAYDGEELIGLAGVSADCEEMWQIGIDVKQAYRKKGVASCLVSKIAQEVLKMGKVPFYCAAWSNISSVRTAIKCGFRPAWCELTVKKKDFVDEMNK